MGRLLRLDKRTVITMVEKGELPGIKLGRVVRVRKDFVDRLLAGQQPSVDDAVPVTAEAITTPKPKVKGRKRGVKTPPRRGRAGK